MNVTDTNLIKHYFPTDHQVNWYVYRSESIRKQLKKLWGKHGPEDKKTFDGMTIGQKISTFVNALFRALENDGPSPKRDWFKVVHDPIHGKCNQAQLGIISSGFYHAHVFDAGQSYEVMWECFKKQKIISIVGMGFRENFGFALSERKPEIAFNHALEAAKKANFFKCKTDKKVAYTNRSK